jgi:hypothetical protein
MKRRVLGVLTPCSAETARRFGGTYRFHLQDQKGKPSKTADEEGYRLSSTSFLLGLLIDPEDRGDIFLRNVWFTPGYT